MSTNIHFSATREVVVVKTGKRDKQEISFNVWQTPTRVTREIMASGNPIQAYKDYILNECSRDEEMLIYDEDDIFQERAPIGKYVYNSGKEHIDGFNEWLEMCEKEGFEVRAEAW